MIGIISSKLYGDYNAYNLAAGSILALELGITLDKIQENSFSSLEFTYTFILKDPWSYLNVSASLVGREI